MATRVQEKLSQLGIGINQYWVTYGAHGPLTPGKRRSWLELPTETQDVLRRSIYNLLLVLADFEGMLVSPIVVDQEIQLGGGDLGEIQYLQVRWGPRTVIILPWLAQDEISQLQSGGYPVELPTDSLILGISPHTYLKTCGQLAKSLRDSGIAFILAGPDDIDHLARLSWTFEEMINYKVNKVFLEGSLDVDAVYSEWQLNRFRTEYRRAKPKELVPLKSMLRSRATQRWLRHPQTDNLMSTLGEKSFTLLVGKSASGKTTLALTVAQRLAAGDRIVWYVDVSRLSSRRTSLIGMSLFREAVRSRKKILVIIDDLQTQVGLAKPLLSFLRFLQVNLVGDQLAVIGISWPEFLDDFEASLMGVPVLNIAAADLSETLISSFGANLAEDTLAKIREQAGEDLFILRLLLENSTNSDVLDLRDLARRVWNSRNHRVEEDRGVLQRALFVICLIGQYECDVPASFVEHQAGVSDKQIEELVKSKLVVRKGAWLSPPHRSFAVLMARFLGQQPRIWHWFKSHQVEVTASGIIVKYLESIDPSQIWAALKLIENSLRVKGSSAPQYQLHMLMRIWESLDALIKRMSEQQLEDPTWGGAVSSAFFACQAFSVIGQKQLVEDTIKFLRDCYFVADGRLEVRVDKFSTRADFERIKELMIVEDQEGAISAQHGLETGSDVDMALTHGNWACGVILGAEAAVGSFGDARLRELAIAVEQRVDSGRYFYPARIPWVTARVLTGLGQCGRTIDNSPTVRRCADWLLASRQEGGAREGTYWVAGTGGWNTELETTSMVLTSLRMVGVSQNNPVLKRAFEWLVAQKPDFVKPGLEIAAASALEAYLIMGGNWSEVRQQALNVANWAAGIALWRNATESARQTQEQTNRASKIASTLIKAMWTTLRDDVPQLLVALGVELPNGKEQVMNGRAATDYSWDIAISYASEDRDYVDRLARCLERAGVRVFYDRFEQADLWGKDLYTHLDDVYRNKARYCVMFLSIDYARKTWTNHERKSAQARAFQENQEYILPVRFDSTEIPGVLPTIGYVNANELSPNDLCKLIQEKLEM